MMVIQYWSVDKVIPYENNPRHNDNAVDAVAKSIEQFGWKQPILVDKDGVIIAGHTRLKAAKKLGHTEVPVVVADKLTKAQADALRIVDNKTGEMSTWDWDRLSLEYVKILEEGSIDMSAYNFDIDVDSVVAKLDAEAKSNLREGSELELDDFGDGQFRYECPECGMRFN